MIIVIMMLLYYIERRSFHIRRREKNMGREMAEEERE